MAPAEPPTEIALRVKVPPGHISGTSNDEFSLGTLSTSIKIGGIRTRIQSLLPSQPSPERQRLLYAGRALVDNEQTLAEALNTRRDATQLEYVVHLLVKGEQGTGAGADGQAHRRAVSTPSGGTPRAGTPLLGAHAVPGGGAMPPQIPHYHAPQPPGNMLPQHAQHMAILQQRQAQAQAQAVSMQMRQAQMQQQQRMMMQGGQQPGAGNPMFAPGMTTGPGGVMLNGQGPHAVQVPLNDNGMAGQPSQQPGSTDAPATGQQHSQTPQPQTANTDSTASQGNDAASTNTTNPTPQPQQAGVHTHPPQQPHPGQQHRPISGQGFHLQGVGPDGNRFEIHQQTLNIPGFPLPAAGPQQGQQLRYGGMPPVVPSFTNGLPPMFSHGMHGMPLPQQNQQAGGVGSALDRARQNVTEMRQMIEEMRQENATEEELQRMQRLEERIRAINDYIDPFGVGRTSRSTSPLPPQQIGPLFGGPGQAPLFPGLGPVRDILPITSNTPNAPHSNPSPGPICFLLSGANGPQALLFSPEHGRYTGSLDARTNTPRPYVVRSHLNAQTAPSPTPTVAPGTQNQQPPPAAEGGQQPQPAAPPAPLAQAQAPAQPAQAQAAPAAAQQDPMQALMGHFWMLFRIMLFSYFFLGNLTMGMGWRRPVALALIGAGFWMIRAGLFGNGGVLRRWWDGIVRVDQPRAQGQQQDGDAQQQPNGRDPTPEQAAQRLLQQRDEALQRAPLHRLREQVRPVERAAALFLASLWPGVGEAHVRAREEAERRAQEEEVARRRAEEERKEQEQREKEREEAEKGEGVDIGGERGDGVEGVEGDMKAVDEGKPALARESAGTT